MKISEKFLQSLTVFNILLVLLDKGIVDALKCYQCDSLTSQHCTEEFDHDTPKIAPTSCDHINDAAYCIKSVGLYQGKLGTRRFCSSKDHGDYCEWIQRQHDERSHRSCFFSCSSDACNGSTRSSSTPAAALLLPLLLLVAGAAAAAAGTRWLGWEL